MFDAMSRTRSPFEGLALPRKVGAFDVNEAGPASRFVFRGTPKALGGTFPLPLPDQPCRSTNEAGCAALWLGPDEWLLIAPPGTRIAPEGSLASCVDVSHRNCGLVIAGPRGANLLNAGCPLDLDVSTFPQGMVTRTLFGKAEIVLWRTAADTFHLDLWRSFASYVTGLLNEASRDLD